MYSTLNKITVFLFAVSLALGLPGCMKDNAEVPGTEVTVRVIAPYVPAATRSEGLPVTDGHPLLFKNGLLLFANDAGTILFVSNVTTGISAGDIIGIDDLTSGDGAKVENVPRICTTVYFFGNIPPGVSAPSVGDAVDDFSRTVIGVSSQTGNDGGVSAVSIYGSGPIGAPGQPYHAKFNASAILSRLEAGQLKADETNVVSFDVAGVFVNYFYPQADITGSTTGSDFIQYTALNLFEENGEIYYSTAYKKTLYDYEPDPPYLGKLDNYYYTPATTGNVWAYNIFPGRPPHLIFKLANVTASASYIAANGGEDPFLKRKHWYITVKGLVENNSRLTAIEPGKVYSLSTIPVNPTTLSPIPEPDNEIVAKVKVDVMKWTDKDLSGSLPAYPW